MTKEIVADVTASVVAGAQLFWGPILAAGVLVCSSMWWQRAVGVLVLAWLMPQWLELHQEATEEVKR